MKQKQFFPLRKLLTKNPITTDYYLTKSLQLTKKTLNGKITQSEP